MKYSLYNRVVLNEDLPSSNLYIGDVVTIVDYLEKNSQTNEPGYIVEIFDVLGNTIDVAVVQESQIES
jgi:hypothetical protein